MSSTYKKPSRGKSEISQAYNSGYVTIYEVTDAAAPGLQPVPALKEKLQLPYEERLLGLRRYYDAKQNQIEVQRVIRVQRTPFPITSQDVAETEDGRKYRIDLVQSMVDVYPPSLDLTLTAYRQEGLL